MKVAAYTCGEIDGASSRLRSFYLFSEASTYDIEVSRPNNFKDGLKADVIHIQKIYSYEALKWLIFYRILGKKVIYDIDDQVNRRREFHLVLLLILFSSVLTVDSLPRKLFWKKYLPFKKVEIVNDVVDIPSVTLTNIDYASHQNHQSFFWLGNSSNFKSILGAINNISTSNGCNLMVSMDLAGINRVKNSYPTVSFIPWFDGVAFDSRIKSKFMILNHDTDKNSRMKSDNKMVLALAAGFIPLVSKTYAYVHLAKRLDAEFLIFDDISNVVEHSMLVADRIDHKFYDRVLGVINSDYSRLSVFSSFKKLLDYRLS